MARRGHHRAAGAGWWSMVAAALPLTVLSFRLMSYAADDAYRGLSPEACASGAWPVALWAALIGSVLAGLVASGGTLWAAIAAIAADERPGLRFAAVVVAALSGLLLLMEVITTVTMLNNYEFSC